ncbi:MAG: hypothetical protein JXP34_08140 [Planctomycetes bacterium]|nr:hypothetical protein [Planctomycetota bacterium]
MTNVEIASPYVTGPIAIAVLAAIVLAAAWGLYRRTCRDAGRLRRSLFIALRLVALALLAVAIAQPVLRYDRIARREGRVAILVDRSLSMSVRDAAADRSRFDCARDILAGDAVARIANLYRVEAVSFAGDASPMASGAKIVPDGESTSLAAAFGAIGSEGGPLAAVVLLSDGCETVPPPVLDSDRLPAVPVHAVAVGSGGEGLEDIRVEAVETEREALVGNAVPLSGRITLRGSAPRPATVELLRERASGPRGAESVLAVERLLEPGVNRIEMEFTPSEPGDWFYILRVPPFEGEIFADDNERRVEVRASARKLHVLYHEGQPRWEYKFIGLALRRDRDIQLIATLRTRPDQLYQQGPSPAPLRGGLPEDRAGFRAFDAIVLGDIDRTEIDPARLEDLQAYVGEDGGGLIVIGGPKAWSAAAWRGSPLEAILPVQLASGAEIGGPLAVLPTPSGLDHPITAGIAERIDAAKPPFSLDGAFALGALKAGATPLLLAKPAGGVPQPVMVVHRYGEGRVVAFATDAAWKWVMQRAADGGEDLYARLWGQLVRWVSGRAAEEGAEDPFRIDRRVVSAGERVSIRARKDVRLRITDPRGTAVEVNIVGEGAWREAIFAAAIPGAYRIGLAAAEGEVPPEPSDTIVAEPNLRERERLDPDRELLRRIAQATGGGAWELPDVSRIPGKIIASTPGAVTRVELSFERTPVAGAAFAIYAAALCLEWWLRRRRYEI